MRRDDTHQPVSAKALALELPAEAWHPIQWREGSNTALASRFARVRVRPARADAKRDEPAPEEWLTIEWPEGETEPDHYWLSTLLADIPFERLVDQTKPGGGSSGTTSNSSRRSVSATTKAVAGAAFTITQRSASRLMVS